MHEEVLLHPAHHRDAREHRDRLVPGPHRRGPGRRRSLTALPPYSGGLAVRSFGCGRSFVALHGFTLGGAQFATIADSTGLRIFAPDLPGHGGTTVTPVTVAATIAALADWIEALPDPIPLLGYSQGGRIALLFALERPDLVERLILVSASPGIRDPAERRARAAADAELAASIRLDGLAPFLDRWLAGPLVGDPSADPGATTDDRRLREANTAEGLAAALEGMGQGAQPWVGDRIGDLRLPMLTVAGARDPRALQIALEMAEAAVDGTTAVIPGVGHNVIRDAPGDVANVLRGFA